MEEAGLLCRARSSRSLSGYKKVIPSIWQTWNDIPQLWQGYAITISFIPSLYLAYARQKLFLGYTMDMIKLIFPVMFVHRLYSTYAVLVVYVDCAVDKYPEYFFKVFNLFYACHMMHVCHKLVQIFHNPGITYNKIYLRTGMLFKRIWIWQRCHILILVNNCEPILFCRYFFKNCCLCDCWNHENLPIFNQNTL